MQQILSNERESKILHFTAKIPPAIWVGYRSYFTGPKLKTPPIGWRPSANFSHPCGSMLCSELKKTESGDRLTASTATVIEPMLI